MLSKYPGRSRLDSDIISGVTTFEALMASDDRIDIFLVDIDLGDGTPSGIDLVRTGLVNTSDKPHTLDDRCDLSHG